MFRAWHWKRLMINAWHWERVVLHVATTTKKLRQQVSREAAAGCSHGRKPMEKIPHVSSPEGATGETNQLDPGLIFETIFECSFHVATFGAFESLKDATTG